MAEVERPTDGPDYPPAQREALAARASVALHDRQLELSLSSLDPLDRLIALNECLERVLHPER